MRYTEKRSVMRIPTKAKSSLRNASRLRRRSTRNTLSFGVTAAQSHASLLACRQEVSSQWTNSAFCTASSASS